MKKILNEILLLSVVSVTLGINLNNKKDNINGSSFSLFNLDGDTKSIGSNSRLNVTTIDGEDASTKYQVVDRGSGTLSTQITTSGDYLITQDDSSTYANEQIVIGPNVNGTIKLKNLNLLYSTSKESYRESTIQVDPTSNVTLYFEGENIIRRNGNYYPAIGYYGSTNDFTGKLTIEGSETGENYIYSGLYASGIGGISEVIFDQEGGKENSSTVGEIVINSGNLTVSAIGSGSAAIGSGSSGHAKGITINGGDLILEADGYKGSASGAVIGSGDSGSCDYVTINGGNIHASNLSSYGSSMASAIGSGSYGECKEITINGGNILAESYDAPAIGLGLNYRSSASNDQKIIINGGTITTSVSTNTSKGIGSHSSNSVPISKIEINGGSIKSSFTIDPINKDNEKVYLAKINEAKDIKDVVVDNTDFNINSNHLNDDSLYLYLPGNDAKVKVNDKNGEETYDVKYINDNSFEVSLALPNEAPIINAEDKYIEIETTITDKLLLEGVTVTDDNDQDLKVYVKSHNVDSSTLGTYEVTYEVKDSEGLASTKTIKVYIYQGFAEINNIPTLIGDDKTIEYGSVFDNDEALKGISANDIEDGVLTDRIQVVSNPVITTEPGEYEVTYCVTDNDGATGYLTIKVKVLERPNEAPIINAEDKYIEIGTSIIDELLLEGVSVTDDNDQDLQAYVKSHNIDSSKIGTYEVTYEVKDSGGLISTKTIKVYIYQGFAKINNVPTLIGEDKVIEYGSVFDNDEALKGISANDIEDGVLTDRIQVVSNPVITTEPGEYEVTYSVTDNDGATSYLTIKVTVLEKTIITEEEKPVITIQDITLNLNDHFDNAEALKYVSAIDKDGDIVTNIEVILNEVDTSKVGEYKIGFKATDKYGISQTQYGVVKVINTNSNFNSLYVVIPVVLIFLIGVIGITIFLIKKKKS